ncbi:MAG: hypothetical protein HY811_06165 [Planctomycetes bacterium]|nr:hypothetical protein [Planctomycetota bacterium]
MFTKHFVGLVAGLFFLTSSCAGISKYGDMPDEIKISYFVLTQGIRKKEIRGFYGALVSESWAEKYDKKLNESFEQLKLPPEFPAVKKAPDEGVKELILVMEENGFYSLIGTDIKKYSAEELNNPGFMIHVLTIQKGDSIYSVAIEDLPNSKKETFIFLKDIFIKNYSLVESWDSSVTYEEADWDQWFQEQIQKNKK